MVGLKAGVGALLAESELFQVCAAIAGMRGVIEVWRLEVFVCGVGKSRSLLLWTFEESFRAVSSVLAIDDAECFVPILILELVGDIIDALECALMTMHQLQCFIMLVFL